MRKDSKGYVMDPVECPRCGSRGWYEGEDGDSYCTEPNCPHAAKMVLQDKLDEALAALRDHDCEARETGDLCGGCCVCMEKQASYALKQASYALETERARTEKAEADALEPGVRCHCCNAVAEMLDHFCRDCGSALPAEHGRKPRKKEIVNPAKGTRASRR